MRKVLFLLSFLIIYNCSSNNKEIASINTEKITPEILYAEAMSSFKEDKYDESFLKFNELTKKYPLSNESLKGQMMIGFIEYLRLNYSESIFVYERIIKKFPYYKDIDYAYYMKALNFYEQIENEELDGSMNIQALNNFKQVINRFPNSKYASDSKQKIVAINQNIAAKHMKIGLFYFKQKKYIAAMNRFQIVIDKHSKTKFAPEAIFRLSEIYFKLGMVDEAKNNAVFLGYNYPKSKWYKRAYNLITNNENDDDSFMKKISNLLKNNEKKE